MQNDLLLIRLFLAIVENGKFKKSNKEKSKSLIPKIKQRVSRATNIQGVIEKNKNRVAILGENQFKSTLNISYLVGTNNIFADCNLFSLPLKLCDLRASNS